MACLITHRLYPCIRNCVYLWGEGEVILYVREKCLSDLGILSSMSHT